MQANLDQQLVFAGQKWVFWFTEGTLYISLKGLMSNVPK